jgi:hypothetical protein
MIYVIQRHHRELMPALQGKYNVFAPWHNLASN